MKTRLAATALPLICLSLAACTSMAARAPGPAASAAREDTPAPVTEARPSPAPEASGASAAEVTGSPAAAPGSHAAEATGSPAARAEAPLPSRADIARKSAADEPRDRAGASARAPMAPSLAGAGIAAAPKGAPAIKAGEWDDNANYREFVRWLASESATPFHPVDVTERRFLVVRDVAGRAVPRCQVVVADALLHRTTLTTSPSGRAVLFPHGEGLSGRELSAAATCAGGAAQARFSLDGGDGVVDLRLATARALPAARSIDVAFILDTTGSMSEEIAAVKSTVQKVTSSLGGGDVRVRIGMVAYKDRGDEYVTKVYPFTTGLAAFQGDVASISAGGGGDMPESVNEGIHVALAGLQWNPEAVGQFAFLIGDAPPHLDYAQDFDYAADMKTAAHRGVQIFTVAASGMDDLGQVVWRQVAEYTNATNLFVLRGGAGPQSTGAGDPKSSCGGTQGNYTSGQLDALILGKIRHELGGLERDPMRIPGLYADENAKPCSERMLATE